MQIALRPVKPERLYVAVLGPNLQASRCVIFVITPTIYCYAWFGWYNDCNGNQTRICLYWDGTNWNVLFGEPGSTSNLIYNGATFPTTGSSVVSGV